jgi:hypothetical protein
MRRFLPSAAKNLRSILSAALSRPMPACCCCERWSASSGCAGGLRKRVACLVIGDPQRHRHLTIGLLAELSAILMVHADRMGALLGVRRIIDQLAHLGEHPLVRPISFDDQMQELLMLHRNVGWRRHCRHRLNAPAAFSRQQPRAIIPQRPSSIRVPDHARQFPLRKPQTDPLHPAIETHLRPPPHPFPARDLSALHPASCQVLDQPVTGRIFFEEVIRENLDVGRPSQVSLVFDRKVNRRTRGPFRTRVTPAFSPSADTHRKFRTTAQDLLCGQPTSA